MKTQSIKLISTQTISRLTRWGIRTLMEEGARAPRLAVRTERSGRIAAEADPVPKRTPAPVLRLGERWRDRGRGPPVHHPGWLGAAPATRPGGSAALIGFDSAAVAGRNIPDLSHRYRLCLNAKSS